MIQVPADKPRHARVTRSSARTAAPHKHIPHAPSPLGHVPADTSFEHAAAMVLGEFQHALAELFAAAPIEVAKVADVERAFGVNHLLGWQLYRMVHARTPLAAGMHVPARVSIKKLLTAASRRKVPPHVTDRISEVFEAFESLVKSDAGGREEMEVMLAAFLPEERQRQDLASRESAFKGMSQIKGVAMEHATGTFLLHPSRDGKTLDRAIVDCEIGLRRLRPDARIPLGTGDLPTGASTVTTLGGSPASEPFGSLLPQFSTAPLPRLETREVAGMTCYRVAGDDVAMRSAIDLVTADLRTAALPAYLEPGADRHRGYAYAVNTPVKRLTLDIFIHRDAYPGAAPRLLVYDASHLGLIRHFDDPAREDDLLICYEEIRVLPTGLAGARIPHVPRYIEVLEYTYSTLGWNPTEFRGYRLDMQFPVYGAVYMLGFPVPEAPANA